MTLSPANHISFREAKERYVSNVQVFLRGRKAITDLTREELQIVDMAWNSGTRCDTCADLILDDRYIVTLGKDADMRRGDE